MNKIRLLCLLSMFATCKSMQGSLNNPLDEIVSPEACLFEIDETVLHACRLLAEQMDDEELACLCPELACVLSSDTHEVPVGVLLRALDYCLRADCPNRSNEMFSESQTVIAQAYIELLSTRAKPYYMH